MQTVNNGGNGRNTINKPNNRGTNGSDTNLGRTHSRNSSLDLRSIGRGPSQEQISRYIFTTCRNLIFIPLIKLFNISDSMYIIYRISFML